ncbi:MAG: hypothetical protein R3331_07620 [Sulfurospirillaceae bacterium]|nr:hypothetical protein [Sulfurospirillaceae bacterium]
MKNILDFLAIKKIVFRVLEKIDPTLLKSRKKLEIYSGVNEKSFYGTIFVVNQKSRFVVKNAAEIIELEQRLESYKKHSYKHKYLIIGSPFCSHAKKYLIENQWRVFEVSHDTL